jgi:hypothetical protein
MSMATINSSGQLDAQRANVSATWYTWLEQGRGGAPSTDEPNLRRFPTQR